MFRIYIKYVSIVGSHYNTLIIETAMNKYARIILAILDFVTELQTLNVIRSIEDGI